jgi:hypothetical protein
MKVLFNLKGHYKFIAHEERHDCYKTVLEEKTNYFTKLLKTHFYGEEI